MLWKRGMEEKNAGETIDLTAAVTRLPSHAFSFFLLLFFLLSIHFVFILEAIMELLTFKD